MCRRVINQFYRCGHRTESEKQFCGNPGCTNVYSDNFGDPGYACPICERQHRVPTPSGNSTADSNISRNSNRPDVNSRSNPSPVEGNPRRLSVDPNTRKSIKLQLQDLARQHTNSPTSSNASPQFPSASSEKSFGGGSHYVPTTPTSTSSNTPRAVAPFSAPNVHQRSGVVPQSRFQGNTVTEAQSQARVPVEYPPPPPNVRKQEKIRGNKTPTMEPAVLAQDPSQRPPGTPRSRRGSTVTARWVGSPGSTPPVPNLPVVYTNTQSAQRGPPPAMNNMPQGRGHARRGSKFGSIGGQGTSYFDRNIW